MKRVLILSFFPAFTPPKSGGEMRLLQRTRRLARAFDVHLIAPTHPEGPTEEVRHETSFRESRIAKSRRYVRWHQVLGRAAGFAECSGLVCSLACKGHRELSRAVRSAAAEADIVIHETPYLLPLLPRRSHARQLFVYNSHNVEARLAGDMFGRGPWGRWAAGRVRSLERALVDECDLLLACSEEDGHGFEKAHRADASKLHVVPNGIDVEGLAVDRSDRGRGAARERLAMAPDRRVAFFIGSAHPPNTEAVHFIATRLAPAMGDALFVVAGKVCSAFSNTSIPPNLRLLGQIDDGRRLDLLAAADVALNPMFSGSGTNLKMLEYLAAGVPVATTPHGARGLRLEHLRHAVIAEDGRFHSALAQLFADASLRRSLGAEGAAHVREHYSSDRIGDRMAELLDHKSSRRVLILNDYPVSPADAGGKIRIQAVANELARAGRQVSIVTLHAEDAARRTSVAPGVEEINIPRGRLLRRLDALLSWFLGCSGDDVNALVFARWLCRPFLRAVEREARFSDAVLFSHCYLAPLAGRLPGDPVVHYDSHNEEWRLKKDLYRGGVLPSLLVPAVRRAERRLARRAKSIFAVSQENLDAIEALSPGAAARGRVIANGVAFSGTPLLGPERRAELRLAAGLGSEFTAVFLGSGHPPNARALRFIMDELAPRIPEASFVIIGSVSSWYQGEVIPTNVILLGSVRSEVKSFLLRTSDLALNPMEVGSGTSLKLFDYLAAGLPVLSTPLGARGVEDDASGAIIRADLAAFRDRLASLAAAPESLEPVRRQAAEYARTHFDWPVVLAPMVRELCSSRTPLAAATVAPPAQSPATKAAG